MHLGMEIFPAKLGKFEFLVNVSLTRKQFPQPFLLCFVPFWPMQVCSQRIVPSSTQLYSQVSRFTQQLEARQLGLELAPAQSWQDMVASLGWHLLQWATPGHLDGTSQSGHLQDTWTASPTEGISKTPCMGITPCSTSSSGGSYASHHLKALFLRDASNFY